MQMHNPPHPGEVLTELCLKPLGLTITVALLSAMRFGLQIRAHARVRYTDIPFGMKCASN